MRITTRQLRRLIREALIVEMKDAWADDDYSHADALKHDRDWDVEHGEYDAARDDDDHMRDLKGDASYDHDDEHRWLKRHRDAHTGATRDFVRHLYEKEDDKWMKKAFSKNKGGLHKALGVPEDETISVTKMAAALRKGGKTEKMARAAVNANPDKYSSIKDVGIENNKEKTI